MSTSAFDTPSLPQRILPLFRGFDGWLVGLVLLLAAAGLLAMYSSGYDHGTRFPDHLKDEAMLLLKKWGPN